jgi:hypothetical protein
MLKPMTFEHVGLLVAGAAALGGLFAPFAAFAACWRYNSKMPSPAIGSTSRSVKAQIKASTRSGE